MGARGEMDYRIRRTEHGRIDWSVCQVADRARSSARRCAADKGNRFVTGLAKRVQHGPADKAARAGYGRLHRSNPASFMGYFDAIIKEFEYMPFSRQARRHSRLMVSFAFRPPVLTPPMRMRTSISGRWT